MTTAPPVAEGHEAPPSRRALVVFAGLMLTMLLATLDTQAVATALPAVVRDLGGIDAFGWVSSAYLLTMSTTTLLVGRLGDLFGRKLMLLASIGCFLTASAACGLATSLPQLIAFRALQGIGGGGLTVTVFAVLGDLFPPRQLAVYQGYSSAVFAVSSVTGPLVGGLITEHLGWRWIFCVNVPIGLAAAALITTLPAAPTRTGGRPRLDCTGIALLSGAVTCLILLANWAGIRYAWQSPAVLTLAAATALLLTLFTLAERRAAQPVLPLSLLHDPTVAICIAVAFIAGFVVPGALNYLSLFLQYVTGTSPQRAGLLLLPQTAGLLAASIGAGHLIAKTGKYRWYPAASMALAAVAAWLLSTMTADTGQLVTGAFMALLGLGIGLSQNVVVLASQSSAPREHIGAATSTVIFARMLGASLGIAVFGAVLTHSLGTTTGPAGPGDVPAHAYAHALSKVFLTAVAVLGLGFLVSLPLRDRSLRKAGGPPGPPAPDDGTKPHGPGAGPATSSAS